MTRPGTRLLHLALNQIGVGHHGDHADPDRCPGHDRRVIVVGVGGGLVRPIQDRWATWLDRAAQEAPVVVEQARAYEAGRRDADIEAALDIAAEHVTMPLPDMEHDKTIVISRGAIPNR